MAQILNAERVAQGARTIEKNDAVIFRMHTRRNRPVTFQAAQGAGAHVEAYSSAPDDQISAACFLIESRQS